jgi:hypothetical protein
MDENDLSNYEQRKKNLFEFGETQEIRRIGSRSVKLHYLFSVAIFEDLLRTIRSAIIIQRRYREYSKSKQLVICFVVKDLYSVITEKEIIKKIINFGIKNNNNNNTSDSWVTII